MGGYRQQLFHVEYGLDRLFILVHRALLQLRHSHDLSVEQLAGQLGALFVSEIPEVMQPVQRLRSGKFSPVFQVRALGFLLSVAAHAPTSISAPLERKRLQIKHATARQSFIVASRAPRASPLIPSTSHFRSARPQVWGMLERPRAALLATLHSMVAAQMSSELGMTEHLGRGVISIKDLREFCALKLAAIVRRDFVMLGIPPPETNVLSSLSLQMLWRQTRVAGVRVMISKLHSVGVETVTSSDDNFDTLVDSVLDTLKETSVELGVAIDGEVATLADWLKTSELQLKLVCRDTLARHSLITPGRWRDAAGVTELDAMPVSTLRQISSAAILRDSAVDMILTSKQVEWLRKAPRRGALARGGKQLLGRIGTLLEIVVEVMQLVQALSQKVHGARSACRVPVR